MLNESNYTDTQRPVRPRGRGVAVVKRRQTAILRVRLYLSRPFQREREPREDAEVGV